jgi:hypothetical protein
LVCRFQARSVQKIRGSKGCRVQVHVILPGFRV